MCVCAIIYIFDVYLYLFKCIRTHIIICIYMYVCMDRPTPSLCTQLGEVGVSVSRCANSERKARDRMENADHSTGHGISADVFIVFLEYAKNLWFDCFLVFGIIIMEILPITHYSKVYINWISIGCVGCTDQTRSVVTRRVVRHVPSSPHYDSYLPQQLRRFATRKADLKLLKR